MGHLHAGLRLPEYHLQATASMHVASERKASQDNIRQAGEAYTLDPALTFDLHLRSLGLRLIGDRVTQLSLHATNLLDAPVAEAGYNGVDLPVLGRSVMLRVRQSF